MKWGFFEAWYIISFHCSFQQIVNLLIFTVNIVTTFFEGKETSITRSVGQLVSWSVIFSHFSSFL